MSIVYQNPTFPWQVSAIGQPQSYSTQMTYRQMLNEVTMWNPDLDPMKAGRLINNTYRRVVDRRDWYGLKMKGAITVKGPFRDGVITVVQGNTDVYGTDTNWNPDIVGMQLRTSFTYSYQTVTAFIDPGHIILDTPYLGPDSFDTPYMCVDIYINFGRNVKRLLWAINQQQGWPMEVNQPVPIINAWDVWRQSLGWSTLLGTRAPSPDGALILECWPAPYQKQVFPFEAIGQPPNLVEDDDCVVPWVSTDLITGRATADAVVMCKRTSPYYNMELRMSLLEQYNTRMIEAELADNDMDQKDVTWDYGQEDGRVGFGPGSTYAQAHD